MVKLLPLIFLLVACTDKFPSDHIFVVDQEVKTCSRYLIDIKNVKFNFDKEIPFNECPVVYGFEEEEIGQIMSWVRRNKNKIDKCASQ